MGLERIFPIAKSDLKRTQMWAMAHPLRLHILGLLVEGPSTASTLGRALGESRSLVSYHLRMLARAGMIVEAPELGDRRERWWRGPERFVTVSSEEDLEGRAITMRMLGLVFARDEEARRRFVARDPGPSRRAGAVVGSWLVELTPDEARALGDRLVELVKEVRGRSAPSAGAERSLVSISVLPWLD
jgi:DNA-binding transcriptional ArsR family regulator